MKLDNESSKNTIEYIKGLMSRYGYVDEVITDNGPQFGSAEFKYVATEYGFRHVTSSPHYPQSNGQAEGMVQTIKKLIIKAKDPHKVILTYRNTQLDMGLSPAQLFPNRRLNTCLPTSAQLLMPQGIDTLEIQDRLKTRQLKSKLNFYIHFGHELKHLKEGDSVVMLTTGKWKSAEVTRRHDTPRPYVVQASDGRKNRRNRKHLRPTNYRGDSKRDSSIDDQIELYNKNIQEPTVKRNTEKTVVNTDEHTAIV